MKFRLTKEEDAIVLELFLKAVRANDDYQKIRFMIKDGLVCVNNEKEYARRRLLFIGDKVTFGDKYYLICPYNDGRISAEQENSVEEQNPTQQPKTESQERGIIVHHQKPLNWSQKYGKKESE